jgi:xanthine dehydrogenase accessory factor
MRERRQIVDLYEQGNALALATLVSVEGSSYRRTGARLLIAADGAYAGAISGGCLEVEVIRKAQWLVRDGATIQQYSTLFDDTADIPYGLGCGGTVEVLLEPANTPEFIALTQAMQASLHGERRHIATQLLSGSKELRRCILSHEGQHIFHSTSGLVDPNQPFFDEWLDPPQRLIIFGAGDDAQPVVSMAALLGWTTIVLDGRPQWARAERFPQAERVLATSSLAGITITSQDVVVIMTHSYEQDRAWLAAVLPSRPRYLGLLGSRHRSALLVSEVSIMLGLSLDRTCEGLFAPVGLDLGGDGADTIALAIIAEMQACLEGKLGTSRRMTPEIVDEQIQQGGASRYLQTQCAV